MAPFTLISQNAYISFASDRLEQVLDQVTKTITSALNTPHLRDRVVGEALLYLARLENHSGELAEIAYGWCAAIWENRQAYDYWETLLSLSLEVGFRRVDPRARIDLVLTEPHRQLAGSVFKSNRNEPIEDLLFALNQSALGEPAVKSLGSFNRYILELHNSTVPFSPRLRQLVLESVALIGYERFDVEGDCFFGFFNHLSAVVEVADVPINLFSTFLEVAQSYGGHRDLAIQSWELLANLTAERSRRSYFRYDPYVISSLLGAKEWEKLECWMGVFWMLWPPEISNAPGDLKSPMESLFRARPGAIRKLAEWMGRSCESRKVDVPESFKRICEQARQATL